MNVDERLIRHNFFYKTKYLQRYLRILTSGNGNVEIVFFRFFIFAFQQSSLKKMNILKGYQSVLLILTAAIFLMGTCDTDKEKAEEQARVDEQIILDYLAGHELIAEKHSSGLYYSITVEGYGEQPASSSTVSVFYKGYLTTGEVFDQTSAEPATFPIRDVIKGWQIGIPLLKEGGAGIFYLPSALAYGTNAVGSIPANSVLIFEVELMAVQ